MHPAIGLQRSMSVDFSRQLRFESQITSNTSCSALKTCDDCIHNNDNLNCVWCSTDRACVAANKNTCLSTNTNTCTTEFSFSYYAIIFIVIISLMICVCCATCYVRRFSERRRGRPQDDCIYQFLKCILPTSFLNYLFPLDDDENSNHGEWMCIICGFDNKKGSDHCVMCGTSHDFSKDYKEKKYEKRKQYKIKKNRIIKGDESNLKAVLSEENMNKHNSKNKMLVTEYSGQDVNEDRDEKMSQISFKLKNVNSSFAQALSPEQRAEALNYRRLNLLSLRQKAGRRRKMWQRQFDENLNAMVWTRVSVKDTRVGAARFGYTPGNSFSKYSEDSFNHSNQVSTEHLQDLLSAASNNSSIYRSPLHSFSAGGNAVKREGFSTPLLSGHEADEKERDIEEATHYNTLINHELIASEAERIGLLGEDRMINARKINSRAANNSALVNPNSSYTVYDYKRGRSSRDSFGDNAFFSNSPGFTSRFDESGALQWQEITSGDKVPASKYASSIAKYPWFNKNNKRMSSTRSFSDANQSHPLSTSPFLGALYMHNQSQPEQQFQQRINSRFSSSAPNHFHPTDSAGHPSNTRALSVEEYHVVTDEGGEATLLVDLAAVAAFTFKDKQQWFYRKMSELQKPWTEGFVRLEVRRANLLEDSHRAWSQLRPVDLHRWFRFQFANEMGVDAGGLAREWYTLITEEIFNPANGFFINCNDSQHGSYHINPLSQYTHPQNYLSYYRFFGRFLGKAIMEQQSIKATLSLPLRKQIIEMPITFSDLEFVDDELFRNLKWLKDNDQVHHLMLDFSITYTYATPASENNQKAEGEGKTHAEAVNKTVTFDLVPNGSEVLVSDDNKHEYLRLRLQHRMLDSIKAQLEQLLTGIYEVIPPELLSVFDYQELELLLCGIQEIDLRDWMSHTEYLGEYHRLREKHPVIKWFWAFVQNSSHEERVKLLQFITGCARLPVQGFKALQSTDGRFRKFNIQSISKTESIYPRAHTCFNKLDLPLYETQEELNAYLSVVMDMDVVGFSME